MAQLNPNFEIDFNDINSYEQIQLINDTQLAKENLLMHRAYKEPSDDEVIRNHFGTFTFVDFCPKIFKAKSINSSGSQCFDTKTNGQTSEFEVTQTPTQKYELETFSDIFERINVWLKLNKDWKVVSIETLIFDCRTQFNRLGSSIHSVHLPQNTRGLRLYLSPAKSRFSGPQKIGCINVVPRKLATTGENFSYENLDQILKRLNELLLTRPIEGRILSVESLTLPMLDGHVDVESNYILDSRINLLNQYTYNVTPIAGQQQQPEGAPIAFGQVPRGQVLIDILRVYYEFGPIVCGLVNLIDFIPRFYSPTQLVSESRQTDEKEVQLDEPTTGGYEGLACAATPEELSCSELKPFASESLTRLIRRSLAWFEEERKQILEVAPKCDAERLVSDVDAAIQEQPEDPPNQMRLELKLCSLQIHHKTLLRGQLAKINSSNILDIIQTRLMVHERRSAVTRPLNKCSESQIGCLSEPYDVKFVRLAYVIPIYDKTMQITIPPFPSVATSHQSARSSQASLNLDSLDGDSQGRLSSRCESLCSIPSNFDLQFEPDSPAPDAVSLDEEVLSAVNDKQDIYDGGSSIIDSSSRESALEIIQMTNERHMRDELAHQAKLTDDKLNDCPIGQLTYRLFAPCQLVNSSSCFAINPMNSSSPLARRGSVDLNTSGSLSSENAHPSNLFLSGIGASSITNIVGSSKDETSGPFKSFSALFPMLSPDVITGADGPSKACSTNDKAGQSRFTSNEFEPVEAIRRRMEIYVTTNSMKVVAGETLVVNLSDNLSCLSTAIEQTVVKASFVRTLPTTWVSIYILYAAVEEPHLPSQLLAQQRMRELSLIAEESEQDSTLKDGSKTADSQEIQDADLSSSLPANIRIERNPIDSSLTIYNSAYDRTLALPSRPENNTSYFDPSDFIDSYQDDLFELNEKETEDRLIKSNRDRRKRSKVGSLRARQADESQCSII